MIPKLYTLCIVQCGKRKIWDRDPKAGPTEAHRVYIGPLAVSCRKYAQRFFPNSWCIISAKYGFLFPGDVVEGPYNVTFSDPTTNPIALPELLKQAHEKQLDKYERIVIAAAKGYASRIQHVFHDREILTPLGGCTSQGDMMRKLRMARETGIPF